MASALTHLYAAILPSLSLLSLTLSLSPHGFCVTKIITLHNQESRKGRKGFCRRHRLHRLRHRRSGRRSVDGFLLAVLGQPLLLLHNCVIMSLVGEGRERKREREREEREMKFCKKYEEYMQEQGKKKLPRVGFKKLKKILKRCRKHPHFVDHDTTNYDNAISHAASTCPQHCPVCDGTFFPSLLEEMSAVVGFFNARAQKLLQIHLSSGLGKCVIWFRNKAKKNPVALTQEGRDLVTYAIINAVAMRKILKKYDKIHYSKQGQAFKSQVQSKHIEILQSPWLCELMAFHINLRNSHPGSRNSTPLFEGCSLVLNEGKPSLYCELFDSVKLDIDLTCAICLETLFDPVSLSCGHMFCYMCACKAASVTIVDGLRAAAPDQKCAICREEGVYKASVRLEELHILLSQSCPEYWAERRKSEKIERVKQTKEHWESQCRLFTGI